MDDDSLFMTLSRMSTLELKSIRRTSLQYRRVIDDVLKQRWRGMVNEMMNEYVRSQVGFAIAKADILTIALTGQGTHIELDIFYMISNDDLDFLREKAGELINLLIQNFVKDRLNVPGYPETLKHANLNANINVTTDMIKENLPNDEEEVRKRLQYYLDLLSITELQTYR